MSMNSRRQEGRRHRGHQRHAHGRHHDRAAHHLHGHHAHAAEGRGREAARWRATPRSGRTSRRRSRWPSRRTRTTFLAASSSTTRRTSCPRSRRGSRTCPRASKMVYLKADQELAYSRGHEGHGPAARGGRGRDRAHRRAADAGLSHERTTPASRPTTRRSPRPACLVDTPIRTAQEEVDRPLPRRHPPRAHRRDVRHQHHAPHRRDAGAAHHLHGGDAPGPEGARHRAAPDLDPAPAAPAAAAEQPGRAGRWRSRPAAPSSP